MCSSRKHLKLDLRKLNHDLPVAKKEMALKKPNRRQIEQNKIEETSKKLGNPIYTANSHQVKTVEER